MARGRFVISTKQTEDGPVKYIGAAQGHSGRIEIVDDEALNKLEPGMGWPQCCLHGTTRYRLASIIANGLRPGGMPQDQHHQDHARQHIHFASSWYPSHGVIPGMRRSNSVIISVDIQRAMKDGIKFYYSTNEVILTRGNQDGVLPSSYFFNVTNNDRRNSLVWRPGTRAPL